MSNGDEDSTGGQPQSHGDYSSDQVEREMSVAAAKAAAERARRRAHEATVAAAEQSRGEKLTIKTAMGRVQPHGRAEGVVALGGFLRR